ncbi:unnamed protein product [Paramecium primaurelia]|uniref:Uncharacterized protein n=1 Tax=Paramecium primaurelia TaxID=5886 RepID=A0A8S1LD81_PARPR|nr:unnamed protein product [Paramecium primaurelia]
MITRKFIKSIKINISRYDKLQDLVILQNDTKVAQLLKKQFIVKNLIDDKIENNYCDTKGCDKIAISKDRKNLIFSSGNKVYFYENIDHQEFNKLEENINFLHFSFSLDSKYLAGCGSNKIIYFWDFKARKVMAKFEGHSKTSQSSCSDDKLIRLWNLNANCNRIAQDGHESSISNIMFSADSLTLKLWDMQLKTLLISKTFDQPINSFSITHNQECLIVGQGGIIQLWNIQYNSVFQKSKFEIIPGDAPLIILKKEETFNRFNFYQMIIKLLHQSCLHVMGIFGKKNIFLQQRYGREMIKLMSQLFYKNMIKVKYGFTKYHKILNIYVLQTIKMNQLQVSYRQNLNKIQQN